jgi:spermidine synthase
MPTRSVARSTKKASPSPSPAPTANIRWLYFLFFFSGISGLIYEVVWVRMLTRVLGSTVFATSTVLAAFMAGLALGSVLSGRFADRVKSPLRLYALLELGVGLSAFATLALPEGLVPLYQRIYDFANGSRSWLTFGQVIVASLVLLVPTSLMGATLPILCTAGARRHADFGRCVGTLYGLNTLGAVVGVLASGFIMIGELGETLTVFWGVVINLAVAAAAGILSLGYRSTATNPQPVKPNTKADDNEASLYPAGVRRAVVACFAFSGFASVANEVVWSRMLILCQGTSIYAFSAMLGVILTGMGVGSFVGGRLVHRWRDPLRQLARLQLGIGFAGALALYLYGRVDWREESLFLAPIVLLGPLGLLWGLAFPVGAACYNRSPAAAGRSVGTLYAWNTVGCIAGALCTGFLLIPWMGASRSGTSLAALSLLLGFLLLAVHPEGLRRQTRLVECALLGAGVLVCTQVGDPYFHQIGRHINEAYPRGFVVYRHLEQSAASTTAFAPIDEGPRSKQLWVNGTGMTCLAPVTKLMAHLPIALADDPRDILVICFGMGTSARSASRHPGLNVHIAELVPGVLECFPFYHADAAEVMAQPTVHAVADDGRNYLLMRPKQQYDVITIDPPPPLYSAGAVNLYTREFFELCLTRLRPGGVMCLWIPPDRLSEIRMIARTFVDVFPNVKFWSGPDPHPGFLLLGSRRPLEGVPERIKAIYQNPQVKADLLEWGEELDRPEKILALYGGDRRELSVLVAGARIITDDSPYTEFYLWRSLDKTGEYYRMIGARREPDAPPPEKKTEGASSPRSP